jgi:hypothetical protein
LFGDHDHGLDAEAAATVVEEVLEGWAEEVCARLAEITCVRRRKKGGAVVVW